MTFALATCARAQSEGLVPTLRDEHRAADHVTVFRTSPRRGHGTPQTTPPVSLRVLPIKSRSRRASTPGGRRNRTEPFLAAGRARSCDGPCSSLTLSTSLNATFP